MRELRGLNDKMEEAVTGEDYERAALYKMRITRINEKITDMKDADTTVIDLKGEDIATAVATMTGVPVRQLKRSEAKMLNRLEQHLGKYVIGQREAIHLVSRAIRRGRSGIAHPKRPIGSFIFMGPTGIGKTELARVLAREVFGSDDALIKIDMSEFGEKHTTARLLGSPAGYVGYDDGGQLTEKIRRHPYSVVLFDEIEKAHRDVFQLLLQLLEDGTLTDAKGRSVDFSNTIVILTSNLGSEKMRHEAALGFAVKNKTEEAELNRTHAENETAARDSLKDMMRPELINRFDNIVVFRALTRVEIGKIFDNMIEELRGRLSRKGVSIKVTPAAKKWLIDKGYDAQNGARPLRRVIQNEVEHAIAEGLLANLYHKGDIVTIGLRNATLTLDVEHEGAAASGIAQKRA